MTRRGGSGWWERWAPFGFTLLVQLLAGVLYAAHLSDQNAQNTKDIAEMKLIIVPRPEIESNRADIKTQLDRIESLLLQRQEKEK